MRGFIFGLVIGLIAGVVLAVVQPERRASTGAAGNAAANAAAGGSAAAWRLASAYPSNLPHLGARVRSISETIERVSGGRLKIKLHEPGQLVDTFDGFDAVASGTIDAAFASAAYWGNKSPAFEIFGGVPFGPDMATFLAWFEHGGGRGAYEKLYGGFNIHAIACGALGPTGAWFAGDAAGLPARVLSALGARVKRIAPSDLFAAFENKTVSGAVFAGPADDMSLRLHRFAPVYYFPGWSRQSGFVDLMINMDRWKALDARIREHLETACGQSLKAGIAEIEDMQFTALKALIRAGVRIERWPAAVVAKLRGTWLRISVSLAKGDPTFGALIRSLNRFAEDRAIWRELSSVKSAPPPPVR
jgi:TRAP-type mannitol/chloroaromatic compound transport system substrate-binding protein